MFWTDLNIKLAIFVLSQAKSIDANSYKNQKHFLNEQNILKFTFKLFIRRTIYHK